MERLLLMEKKERLMMQHDYGSLFNEKKVGMIAIRDGVQNEFENFLCNGWVKKIESHLKVCFVELSDQNANLGLPMPASEVYKKPLTHLIALMPTVFSDVDSSMWQVTEEREFKEILLDRVKIVCRSCQWMQFQKWSFWDVVNNLNENVSILEKKWHKQLISFDAGIVEASMAHKMVHNTLNELVEAIGKNVSNGSLSDKFMDALLGKDDHIESGPSRITKIFQKAMSFMLSSFKVEEMPSVCKLERFPLFIESFRAHITTQIAIGAENFQVKAKKYISDLPDVVKIEYIWDEERIDCNIAWNTEYKKYYNNIITILLKEILSVPALTENWEISESYLEENCVVERLDLLKQMTDIATGLSALQNFILRIENNQRGMNSE